MSQQVKALAAIKPVNSSFIPRPHDGRTKRTPTGCLTITCIFGYIHAHMYMQNKEINVIKQETGRKESIESQGLQDLLPAKYPYHGFHREDKGDSHGGKAGSNQGFGFSLISFHYCNDRTG